ncbi:MAG: ABC transporter permease, partial [Proteobacteria bacterium]|nr:ABC transporter permease [Pseudomonadota bacterium]
MNLKHWLNTPTARALMALGFVVIVGCLLNADGAFFRWGVHRDMLRQVSVYGILACGMTVVIITAGIDLSVSSLLALCAVSFAGLTLVFQWPALPAIALVLVVGATMGALSGCLVARFRLQPFIVTLAMMVFARGLAKYLSGGRKITNYVLGPDGVATTIDHPPIFGLIDTRICGDNLSVVTIIFLVCVAITWVALARMRFGRYCYAIGGNKVAARLSGVPVQRTLV